MKPQRIQRKRTKGWRMPENTVYVGRPTQWGNPFYKHGDGLPMDNALAKALFAKQLRESGGFFAPGYTTPTTVEDIKKELSGKNLACFCSLDEPCHADVLLELANAKDGSKQDCI